MVTENLPARTESFIDAVGFGKYNIAALSLLCASVFIFTLPVGTYRFATHDVEYRCYVPECVEGDFYEDWLPQAIPRHHMKFERCKRYLPVRNNDPDFTSNSSCPGYEFNHTVYISCNKWVYGERHSIIQEFNIPCVTLSYQMIIFCRHFGKAICYLISGFFADKLGRKTLILLAGLSLCIFGISETVSYDFNVFLAVGFLREMLSASGFSAACILCFESTAKTNRIKAFAALHASRMCSALLLGAFATQIPSWRTLYQVCYFPTLVSLVFMMFLDESISWQLLHKRNRTNMKMVRQVEQANNISLSEHLEKYFDGRGTRSINEAVRRQSCFVPEKVYRVSHIWESRQLLLNWLSCAFCITTVHMVSSFLSQCMNTELPLALHYNYLIVHSLQALAIVFYFFFGHNFSAKLITVRSLIPCAIGLFMLIFVDQDKVMFILSVHIVLSTVLALTNLAITYYIFETTPTSHRFTIYGCCLAISCIFKLILHFLPVMVQFKYIIQFLFCVASVAGLCIVTDYTDIGVFDTVSQGQCLINIKERLKAQSRTAWAS